MTFSEMFEPLDEKRKLGTIDTFTRKDSVKAASYLLGRGYQVLIVNIEDFHDVIFFEEFTPEVVRGIELYYKYLENMDDWSGNNYAGLTLEEHRELGRLFGYSDPEIEWFVEDLKLSKVRREV